MDIFDGSDVPLNARQLYERLEDVLDKATVYRSLKYLEKNGNISSFVLDCHRSGVERYFYSRKATHGHFFHCTSCHHFVPLDDCPLKGSLEAIEKDYGFSVEEHFLTLKGLCRECKPGEALRPYEKNHQGSSEALGKHKETE